MSEPQKPEELVKSWSQLGLIVLRRHVLMYSDTILANQENVVISYMNAYTSNSPSRGTGKTNTRLDNAFLPSPAPNANPPLPRAGVSRSIRKLLDATTPGGVRGICNKHCNPQCLWDETKRDFVNHCRITTLKTLLWMMGASSSVATKPVKDLILPHNIKCLRA